MTQQNPPPHTHPLNMSVTFRRVLIVAGFVCFLISALDPGLGGEGSWQAWLSGGFSAWCLAAFP